MVLFNRARANQVEIGIDVGLHHKLHRVMLGWSVDVIDQIEELHGGTVVQVRI